MPLKAPPGVEPEPRPSVGVHGHALDHAYLGPQVSEALAVDHRAGRRAVEIELRRAARKDRLEILRRDLREAVVSTRSNPLAQELPVVARHACHIDPALHAALYLQGGHARLCQLQDVRAKAEVSHGERQRLRAFVVRIRHPAAVRAGSAVAAAAPLHRAEKTEPGDGVAERTMYEHLDLDAAAARYRGNLGEAEFARKDHAAEAELPQREDPLQVMGDELRGRMQREIREMAAAEPRYAQVLDDDGVGTKLVELRKRADRPLHGRLVEERVERNVDLAAVRTRHAKKLVELLEREVFCERPGGEFPEAAVDGVGAGRKRRARRGEVPRWRQQFRKRFAHGGWLHAANYTKRPIGRKVPWTRNCGAHAPGASAGRARCRRRRPTPAFRPQAPHSRSGSTPP